ncbi:MAG: hypothetical protein B7Z75_09660 [Acidocella sp. 20-57-95]|nr:MAG: hypothetical protein B7Z75_09660 [Acidocella sp. 20-57-95]OYV62059.1 MAG: hypothetical protein B7Z71_02765 [Acidocella sp. 21-58-7]HQT65407.1 hypothetical protein [Acidocella sp.]HQU04091.1 hypothetical protein [Acidocella sp.]
MDNRSHFGPLPAFLAAAALLALSACATTPPSAADQANLDACTAKADASYNAQNIDSLSRTDQTGVRYSATPNHVFDGQQLGLMHQRDSQITDCVNNGTASASTYTGKPLPAPQIITH